MLLECVSLFPRGLRYVRMERPVSCISLHGCLSMWYPIRMIKQTKVVCVLWGRMGKCKSHEFGVECFCILEEVLGLVHILREELGNIWYLL